eukprot:7995265-Alexandrium_andersonii.AAC.1
MARPPGVASTQEATAILNMLIAQFEAHLHQPDEGAQGQDAGFVYMLVARTTLYVGSTKAARKPRNAGPMHSGPT